jgi:hypothetical protein
VLSVLYYRYEEEKDQDPETPQLARSRRALSSRWSDEEPQEGSEQEGMPRKGASMKVGDLIYDDHYGQGIVVEIDEAGDHTINFPEAGKVGVLDSHMIQFVEVISASR